MAPSSSRHATARSIRIMSMHSDTYGSYTVECYQVFWINSIAMKHNKFPVALHLATNFHHH